MLSGYHLAVEPETSILVRVIGMSDTTILWHEYFMHMQNQILVS